MQSERGRERKNGGDRVKFSKLSGYPNLWLATRNHLADDFISHSALRFKSLTRCFSGYCKEKAYYNQNAEGGTRTPTGCPIRPSNVRVYQFHHFGNIDFPYDFYLGEGAGEAEGTAPLDVGPEGAGVATGDGEGLLVPPSLSLTTELGALYPGIEKISASIIKMIAATTVAFSSGFCAPRGPNAV